MNTPENNLHTALLVFARKFVDEMRYINYPAEWSREPLASLVGRLVTLLNYHPGCLGDHIQNSYKRTFPKMSRGNLNQLTTGPFAITADYFSDEYAAWELAHSKPAPVDQIPLQALLRRTASDIVDTFAELKPAQENEHRTLERICFNLKPVYNMVRGAESIGWDLAEYADHWRTLDRAAREELARSLHDTWSQQQV